MVLKIYVDAPVLISCIKVEDMMPDGDGAQASLNSGGIGSNWVFIDVQGRYGKGFHFHINLFGVPDYKSLLEQYRSKA